MWDTVGAAATGAGVASSATVATTFFAPTGLTAWLGLAAATTPAGWVVAAALVAGGGYYGVSRWFNGKGDAFVDIIPKYITTPIDVLGAALIDLLGSLALRVAAIDGKIDPRETACIADHFVHDWGFDADYVSRALDTLAARANDMRVKQLASDLAAFTEANPDCNASAMQAELLAFLRELIAADGVVDEREELALEAIERVLAEANRMTLAKASDAVADIARTAGDTVATAAGTLGSKAATLGNAVGGRLAEAAGSLLRRGKGTKT